MAIIDPNVEPITTFGAPAQNFPNIREFPVDSTANDDNTIDQTTAFGAPRQVFTNIGTFATDISSTGEQLPLPTTQAGKSENPSSSASKPGKRYDNPLSNFSSYTYQLTLYMITPDAYELFVQNGRRNINAAKNSKDAAGAYVVVQSGGINNTASSRAPGFDLDYYIDDLKMASLVSSHANGTSTAEVGMTFTIYEPYGFSFITKLREAMNSLANYSTTKNFKNIKNPARQFFIMGIRFQGYDKNGNTLTSSSDGIYEKFYDIMLNSIKFKIDGKMSTYLCDAVIIPTKEACGIKRGMITNGAEVVASTVGEALDELMGRISREQKLLATNKTIEEPNNFSVRFFGDGASEIQKASIVNKKTDADKAKLPMAIAKTIQDVTPTLEVKSAVNVNKKQVIFKNDTPVLQAISQLIAQSSYLEDALTKVYTTAIEPDQDKNSPEVVIPNTKKTIRWYNAAPRISNARWDNIIGDFAYDVEYVIQPYDTPAITSAYANKPAPYPGPYKRYDYWYTGKNSEILHYEQTMNLAFVNVALAPSGTPDAKAFDMDIPQIPGRRTAAPRLGATADGFEAQNNYITNLIDPAAYASAKITILGDPDYLMTVSPSGPDQIYDQYYGNDGYTINPNGGQVFIELNFYEGVDYQNSTGTMKINDRVLFWKYPPDVQQKLNSRGGGVIYQVIEVHSMFKGGKFTQELSCILPSIPGQAPGGITSASSAAGRETDAGTTTFGAAKQNFTNIGTFVTETSTDPNDLNVEFNGTETNMTFDATTGEQIANPQIMVPTGNAANPQVASDDSPDP